MTHAERDRPAALAASEASQAAIKRENYRHTPGPWTRMGKAVGVSAGEIATAWDFDGRQIANARLIAAAPEMLDALKAIVDCAGPGDGPEIGLALDAIQKATGDTE